MQRIPSRTLLRPLFPLASCLPFPFLPFPSLLFCLLPRSFPPLWARRSHSQSKANGALSQTRHETATHERVRETARVALSFVRHGGVPSFHVRTALAPLCTRRPTVRAVSPPLPPLCCAVPRRANNNTAVEFDQTS
jgi:hypothetical protein